MSMKGWYRLGGEMARRFFYVFWLKAEHGQDGRGTVSKKTSLKLADSLGAATRLRSLVVEETNIFIF